MRKYISKVQIWDTFFHFCRPETLQIIPKPDPNPIKWVWPEPDFWHPSASLNKGQLTFKSECLKICTDFGQQMCLSLPEKIAPTSDCLENAPTCSCCCQPSCDESLRPVCEHVSTTTTYKRKHFLVYTRHVFAKPPECHILASYQMWFCQKLLKKAKSNSKIVKIWWFCEINIW